MSTRAGEGAATVRAGAEQMGLSLDDCQVDRLLAYAEMIGKWNRVYNLTALRTPQEVLTHHLLDSLSVVGPLRRHTARRAIRLLDVGAGAGLPGVVIAICCPDVVVDCVDAVAKKAAFVQQVAANLKLANLRGLHARVESLEGAYDVITSRAFASLADFTQLTQQLLAPDGAWLAMKGREPAQEVQDLGGLATVFHVERLTVPGLNAERCLVWMNKRKGLT